MNLGYLVDAAIHWKQLLPRVHPFFAFKANSDPILTYLMMELNFGFDCASLDEIQKVIKLGVHPSKVIYANTHKQTSHLRQATSLGINLGTFDDESELFKIKKVAPHMRLLLRLSTTGFGKCLSKTMQAKFGCVKSETRGLLETAKQLGLNVKGVCFHIGLGAQSPELYRKAISEARKVFSEGLELGFKMSILDIGGGFPCKTATNFSKIEFKAVAKTICESLNTEFPSDDKVQIIGEPGTFFTAPLMSLAVNIIGKRKRRGRDVYQQHNFPDTEYFINDGIYSSFRLYWDAPLLIPVVKPVDQKYFGLPVHKSTLWGQTCAEDVAVEDCELPDMDVGDWMCVKGEHRTWT
ncbi:Ornithine decarboxylase [Holothuria leucospilota]|uniref:Ornithine decarboxylase n=1 Tax=Holothuria leucospilota TaxID=206669 RepID=A0A9Q1C7P7_HOLLE|nr:Ornithine decarboxylase [Holothuria leucospilota]